MYEIWRMEDEGPALLIQAPDPQTVDEMTEAGFQKVHEFEAPCAKGAQREFIQWVRGFQPEASVREVDLSRLLV